MNLPQDPPETLNDLAAFVNANENRRWELVNMRVQDGKNFYLFSEGVPEMRGIVVARQVEDLGIDIEGKIRANRMLLSSGEVKVALVREALVVPVSDPANDPAASDPVSEAKFVNTMVEVFNRGIPKRSFLRELVEWARTAPNVIFEAGSATTQQDVYANVEEKLGPFRGLRHRKACMLEVMRVLAGFESSWNWNTGIDTTRLAPTTNQNAEAGAWQVSADSLVFGQDLKDLVRSKVGSLNGGSFQVAMKANHPLAMEYVARLMRHTMKHNGPLYKDRSIFKLALQGPEQAIYKWLSTAAVAEFESLL